MAYSSAVFYLDYEAGSDTARTSLTAVAVANNGAGLVRCTKATHGLVTGAVGTASLNYAGTWKVTVIDANTFDLVGSTYSTATALTFVPFGGSSKADAWQTFGSGATAARIAPGDTIRVMASPDETLVGNATWTQYSRTVTLTAAVTANIATCDTAWTASANVTATATSTCKEGSNAASLAIATAFTTGLVAYFATGTLDLSGYQQVSFWIKNNAAVAASVLSLRLCSDTAGVTTVHTVAIPALPGSSTIWTPLTVDLGANMNSAIASVALYATIDPGVVTVVLDNILACKAASSANSLTLTSLIGKAANTFWRAATTYSVGDARIPTAPNRNGYYYKVTAASGPSGATEPTWPLGLLVTVADGGVTWRCEEIEEPWVPVKSINGADVKIDGSPLTTVSVGRGYNGTTETVPTYKRETIKLAMVASTLTAIHSVTDAGTAALPLVYSGGWNRTDMSTQSGQSWFDAQNGNGAVFSCGSFAAVELRNVGAVRGSYGVFDGDQPLRLSNVQLVSMTQVGLHCNSALPALIGRGLVVAYCTNGFTFNNPATIDLARFRIDSCDTSGIVTTSSYHNQITLYDGTIQNNAQYGLSQLTRAPFVGTNVRFGNNATAAINPNATATSMRLLNCLFPEASPITAFQAGTLPEHIIYSSRHNQVANQHLIYLVSGNIAAATDQRHTASGIAWKFTPATPRSLDFPLRLSVAKIACAAGVAVSVSIWSRRDSTNIVGTLKIFGGQIAGVPSNVTVTCAPAINSWEQSGALAFTPTEVGVVEIVVECYDLVGLNNFWIDDLVVS